MSFFSAQSISAGYDREYVIRDICFELSGGTLTGILGANGSGKTTLLKVICGILPHEGGCILEGCTLEGLPARKIAGMCSYIPQRSGIAIDISALDVVLMGFNPRLGLLQHPDAAMQAAARHALETVGLAGREHENYQHLSEGQKQLCILARTLVMQGRLLLLDEPESALDFRYRYRMLEIIRAWVKERNTAALAALHDPTLALNYCDRLLILSDGKCLGSISPGTDSLAAMEEALCRLYGQVSLHALASRGGGRRLVMIKEDDA